MAPYIDESDRVIRRKITYRDVWNRCLAASIGELRIGDVRVSTVDRVIREIGSDEGPRERDTPRSYCRASSGMAVRHDALGANPVRELSDLRRKS